MPTQLAAFHSDKEQAMEFNHIPVLLNETIEGLNIKENGIYAMVLQAVGDTAVRF